MGTFLIKFVSALNQECPHLLSACFVLVLRQSYRSLIMPAAQVNMERFAGRVAAEPDKNKGSGNAYP